MATNGILQAVLRTMEENHPSHFTVNSDSNGDISPTRMAIELGLTRGYSKYGDTLILLARPLIHSQNVPEPTYAPPVPREAVT